MAVYFLLVALELVWEDRRTIEPNEILPELSGLMYGHEPKCTVRSVPRNATLAFHPIASIFIF